MAKIDLGAPSTWLDEYTKVNLMMAEIYSLLSALLADRHNHTNKTILDAITAAFSAAEKAKLANITDKFKGLFANATARNAAVTAPASGDYILQSDTNTVWFYNGTAWVNTGSTATGDMLRAVYDPTSKNADAFSMGNMTETAGSKIFTSAERAALAMYRGSHDTSTTMLALTSLIKGNWCTRIDTKTIWLYDGAEWVNTSIGMAATIVNNLTTGGSASVLSAEQGKVLKAQVDAKPSLATVAPLAHAASASVGTSARAAKEDHVHARDAQPFTDFGVYVIRCDSDDLLNNGLVQFTPGETIHWHGNHGVTILGTSELYLAAGFVYEVTCYMRAYTSSDPSGSLTTTWQIMVDDVDTGIAGAFAPPDDSLLIAGSYPAIAFVDCRSVAKLVSVQKNSSGGTGPDMRVVTKVMKIAV